VGEDEAGLERTRLVSAPLDTWLKRHTLGLEVSRDKGEPLPSVYTGVSEHRGEREANKNESGRAQQRGMEGV